MQHHGARTMISTVYCSSSSVGAACGIVLLEQAPPLSRAGPAPSTQFLHVVADQQEQRELTCVLTYPLNDIA
jgi:hypothetical protein